MPISLPNSIPWAPRGWIFLGSRWKIKKSLWWSQFYGSKVHPAKKEPNRPTGFQHNLSPSRPTTLSLAFTISLQAWFKDLLFTSSRVVGRQALIWYRFDDMDSLFNDILLYMYIPSLFNCGISSSQFIINDISIFLASVISFNRGCLLLFERFW